MNIIRRRAWDMPERDLTPEHLFFNRRAFLLGGATALALAPRTEMMFVVFTCIYAFVLGFCYAAFGAVVLEAIGAGAAATKYNLLAGISNAPIIYQTMIDGWGHDHWGASGLLYVDALGGVAAVAVYAVVAVATRARFAREAPA